MDVEQGRPFRWEVSARQIPGLGPASLNSTGQEDAVFTRCSAGINDSSRIAAKLTRLPSADECSFTRVSSFETETVDCRFNLALKQDRPYRTEVADAEDAGLRSAFIRHFRRASNSTTLLDGKELIMEAVADCSEGGTFQTSMPMYSLYFNRRLKWPALFHIALAFIAANKLATCIDVWQRDRKCEGTHFRFTPLELRGRPYEAVSGPGVSDFGLLYRGCGLGGANRTTQGDSLVASFRDVVGINGWWFTTAQLPAARDPIRFVLEASRDGSMWRPCGASRFVAVPSASEHAWMGWGVGVHSTTVARGAVEVFGLEVPWQFVLDHVLVMLTHTLANLIVFGLLLLRRPMSVHRIFLGSHCLCATLYLLSTALYALQGNFVVASIPATYTLHFARVCYTLCKINSLSRFSANCLAGYVAAGVVQYLIIFSNLSGAQVIVDGYREALPLDIKTAFSASFIPFCCYLWAERGVARSVAEAKDLIAADEREYSAAWAAYIASPRDSAALDGIEVLVRTVWGSLRPGILHQRAGPSNSLKGRWEHTPPIYSLERIFAQAEVAAPLLRSKVKAWALLSGGLFPVGAEEDNRGERPLFSFERWGRITGIPEEMARVKWAKVKSKKRAVEKVYRCYAGDVSRLVDCCRSVP